VKKHWAHWACCCLCHVLFWTWKRNKNYVTVLIFVACNVSKIIISATFPVYVVRHFICTKQNIELFHANNLLLVLIDSASWEKGTYPLLSYLTYFIVQISWLIQLYIIYDTHKWYTSSVWQILVRLLWNLGCISGRGKIFFLSPKSPDWFWGSPSLLYIWYWGFFPWV